MIIDVETQEDADAIVTLLQANIGNEGCATVGSLKNVMGENKTITYMDYKRGWVVLNDISIEQNREGRWVLTLPEPRRLVWSVSVEPEQ